MSDASFVDIPEELQIDILSRLPPKPLSRCNCVSKHWNDTLTIQTFLLKHSRSYDKHSKLAFMAHWTIRGYDSVFSFEFSNKKAMAVPKTTKMTVRNNWTRKKSTEEVIKGNHECFTNAFSHHKCNLMSNLCNDLICLFDQFSTRVGLLNLKTQDFIRLPAVTKENAGCNIFWYALGFDPVSKLYKVLSLCGGSVFCHTKAAILTLGSYHWKPVEYKLVLSAVTMNWLYWKSNDSFCLDGVIYWVNENEIDGCRVVTVFAFDLNGEVFRDYMLNTIIPIKDDVDTIKYYLTSLKGNPTLFIWHKYSDEMQQLTLFNHNNPNVSLNRKSFSSSYFPKKFPYGTPTTCVAGGSILLQHVTPIKNLVDPQEQDNNSQLSWYIWYDLENFAID